MKEEIFRYKIIPDFVRLIQTELVGEVGVLFTFINILRIEIFSNPWLLPYNQFEETVAAHFGIR